MKKIDILKNVTFGNQIAEDESATLASYFVTTNDWDRVARGDIDVIRGEKGAGKSAIYSLLLSKRDEFFDKDVLLIPAENPRGTTVFKDLSSNPPTTEREFIFLWKLYAIALIAREMRQYDITNAHANEIYSHLETIGLLEREHSLSGMLRRVQDYVRRIINAERIEGGLELDPLMGTPSGVIGRIVLHEPSENSRKAGFRTIDELFEKTNLALRFASRLVWLLFDRLDVAFQEDHNLEENALRALMRMYVDCKAYDKIDLKIFIREDIWARLVRNGFREYSHITKYLILSWNNESLLNLLMKRLLNNQMLVDALNIKVADILASLDAQQNLFYKLFPQQVEQGQQKAATFKWLTTRCADGTDKTAPRELIHLVNEIKDEQIRRLEVVGGVPPPDMQLFDRSVFKLALPAVSKARLVSYLYAEYPSERPFILKLEGQKTEQTGDSLSGLWGLSRDSAVEKAKELTALGLFQERGIGSEATFWVPFLYRPALKMVQGRAESDDD